MLAKTTVSITPKLSALCVLSLLISGCGNTVPKPVKLENNLIRQESLTTAALELGSQEALSWRTAQIAHTISKQNRLLDQIFNFNAVLVNGNVLPPVLAQANKSINLADSETIRTADRTYQIVSKAHFITQVPTWRQYFKLSYQKPKLPPKSLQPQNPEEMKLWNDMITKGWEHGLKQADKIFIENVSKLKRDYIGMTIYHALVRHKMISAPIVSSVDLGVTGDTESMRLNDRVMRIVENSKLKPSGKWRPIVVEE